MFVLPLHRRTALAARKSGRLLRREARIIEDGLVPPRIRISYFALPGEDRERREVVTVDGIVHQPLEATNRPIEYYGQTFIVERELLLDAPGTMMIEIDGEIVPLVRNLSGTGALFPWEHEARAESVVDPGSEGPARRGRSAIGTAVRNTRLGALALDPRRIRPALARRVGRLRRRLPTQRLRQR